MAVSSMDPGSEISLDRASSEWQLLGKKMAQFEFW